MDFVSIILNPLTDDHLQFVGLFVGRPINNRLAYNEVTLQAEIKPFSSNILTENRL